MRIKTLAVVALLLAALAVPTAAAVAVNDRGTDDAGAITLEPHDGPNGAYATVADGDLAVELADLNDEAVTTADRVFTVTADEEPVRVAVEHGSDAVTFYRGDDPDNAVDSRDDAVRLDPGESMAVGVEVDTRDRDDVSLSSVTVVALSPDGEESVDEEDVVADRLTGPGADESEFDGIELADDALVFVDGSVDRDEVTAGETVTATAAVTNRKNRSATVAVPFRVDGVTVDEREVRVGANETRTVTFERRFDRRGEYALSVGDEAIGTVAVAEPDGPSPAFAVTNATVDDEAAVGESVTAAATVANDGDADGTFTAELVVDGSVVATQRIAVPAGERRAVTFERTVRNDGSVEVAVSGTSAGTVRVGDANAGLVDSTMLATSASGVAIGGPLLLGAAIVRRRRRKGI